MVLTDLLDAALPQTFNLLKKKIQKTHTQPESKICETPENEVSLDLSQQVKFYSNTDISLNFNGPFL